MVDTGDGRLPQWIELTNVSETEVSLKGWALLISNAAADAETVATTNGSGRAIIALPATPATLTASATGYTSGTLTLPARTTPTTPATSPNTGETPEPRRTIAPEVLMGAAQRPPMLWVDGGVIYALVGADVQEFAIGLENVQNLAVSGNKVYYTEKTGENSGTINAMNLDGTGAKQLVSIKAVPKGIAVDPV